MDITAEIRFLLTYVQCQHDAEALRDADAAAYHERFARRSLKRINRWADMANAAIAHAEFQVSSHSRNGDDAPMDGATYIRERGKLWDAFMEARARAKATNQS